MLHETARHCRPGDTRTFQRCLVRTRTCGQETRIRKESNVSECEYETKRAVGPIFRPGYSVRRLTFGVESLRTVAPCRAGRGEGGGGGRHGVPTGSESGPLPYPAGKF